jgi:signal transduction histidine kinase
MLAFPSGRLSSLASRLVVPAAYANVLILGFARAATLDFFGAGPADERFQGVLGLYPDFELANSLHRAYEAVGIGVLLAAVAILLRRWRGATPAARRALAPLWLAGMAFAVSITLAAPSIVGGATPSTTEVVCCTGGLGYPGDAYLEVPERVREVLFWLARGGQILVPIAFLFGLLRMRLDRMSVSDFVLELGEDPPPGRVRDALAIALRDPSLVLAFWAREAGGYLDAAGSSVELPGPDSGRAVTVLERRSQPVVAILHDPALDEHKELIRALGTAAALAFENEQLRAELQAQLDEVRASRSRIIEAADAERRKVERDLHDGAQQRLVTLTLALQMARGDLAQDADPRLATALQDATDELRLALTELRELARGIHPAILTEDGLGPALAALAARCAVPATVRSAPKRRFSPTVEATAYFVVSEALTNVGKHARASRVDISVGVHDGRMIVEVSDDGVGGASLERGTGLRGIADRVAALGGRLECSSPPEQGTRVMAQIPCA